MVMLWMLWSHALATLLPLQRGVHSWWSTCRSDPAACLALISSSWADRWVLKAFVVCVVFAMNMSATLVVLPA